ncbi:glycine zipper 2TM domain-containing protein [Sphingomonas sp. ID1715]|nr:glycine zipper 2TM domain-containing protein [Sphingomonas sp. ID1715]
MAATAAPTLVSAPAEAQNRRQIEREYRQDMRQAQRERRQALRDWRQARRYDWNRLEPGQRVYYADRYYRDGRYYRERALTRNDRIYRGNDGRYYCRRSDGTTGLIIGGAVGALLGNAIDGGRSSILGTLIGGAAGAALGREVQRGQVRCR